MEMVVLKDEKILICESLIDQFVERNKIKDFSIVGDASSSEIAKIVYPTHLESLAMMM